MNPDEARKTGATTEQLRHDIDRGRTADKVPVGDPAAAPLGTDEEAAGTPVDPELVARTRSAETARQPAHDQPRGRIDRRRLTGLAVILVVALAAAWLFWGI